MYQVGFLAVLDLLLKHMTSFSVYYYTSLINLYFVYFGGRGWI